jgi:hypothetical protein
VDLVENKGAVLQFDETRSGRLCELAVVAAAGTSGIAAPDVVTARRNYAMHLGVELSGPISDSRDPIHIIHAIDHSNHNTKARNRINIGTAVARYVGGRYYLH